MNIHRQEISHKLLQRGYERSTSSDYHTLPHVVYFADNAAQARHLSTIINHIASRIEAIARECKRLVGRCSETLMASNSSFPSRFKPGIKVPTRCWGFRIITLLREGESLAKTSFP